MKCNKIGYQQHIQITTISKQVVNNLANQTKYRPKAYKNDSISKNYFIF